MPIIEDEQLGRITVRKSSGSSLRASVAPNGTLRVSVPAYTPMFVVKRMVAAMRGDLRKLIAQTTPQLDLHEGMQIGKSHTLHIRRGSRLSVTRSHLQITVTLGNNDSINDMQVISLVRDTIRTVLRREAKAHLPKRIKFLAESHGYTYTSLRFTHASSRWGSCNSSKGISLNIALMNLPFELIDYVLLHELAHTVELNHSDRFWNEVAKADSNYRVHRKDLKQYNPTI